MNQKGQAFSVFKLLIAAIVAVAILAILIPIIMKAIIIIKKNPVDETKTLISNLANNPGTLNHTSEVTFESQTNLPAASIIEGTSLSAEQICFSRGYFRDSPDFQSIGTPADNIIYRGSTERYTKIAVMCHNGKTNLIDNLNSFAESSNMDYLSGDYLETCNCTDAQTCCAVILEPT